MLSDLFAQLHFVYIFVSSVLFLAGIYVAPSIVERDIHWLLRYPRWVAGLMEKYFSGSWGFLPIFLLILLLNNISLFIGFASGFLIVLPLILAFLTGFHVAVIGYDLLGWQGIWQMLMNPVAWLEFPAAWISFALGLRLSGEWLQSGGLHAVIGRFILLVPLYFKYVFMLLLLAALIESLMIVVAEKNKDKL